MLGMRVKVALLTTILLISTLGTMFSSEFVDSQNKMETSIGNMPKNIAEAGDVGLYSSMKIDSMNNPHIAYYDADNGDLIYTKYDGWNWNTTTIDSDGDVGSHASLVLDKFENPHLSYYDATNEDLKYAYFDGSQWTNTSVDSEGSVGTYTTIDVSTNINPHIAYRDETNTNLKYAYYNGSTWINMTLDGNWGGVDNVGKYAALELDSGNWPHVSYYNETGGDLMYMYNDGTTWYKFTAYSINNVGLHSDIVLDSNDLPQFIHYNMQFQNLMYTTFDGTNWTTDTVDSDGRVGEYCTIALDSNDLPHVAYLDRDNSGRIKYGHLNQSWNLSAIEEEGEYISIDIDSRERAHFSYYDLSDKNLRYLSHSGANVDQITDAITFNKDWGGIGMVLDSQEVPHIVYQNHSDGNYKVSYATLNVSATESSGSNVWIIETIDGSLGDYAGSWLSIDIDSQDIPHVSYFAGDNIDEIRYAFRNDSGWQNQTVDDGIDRLGFYSSIKIDSTDNPQIVYSRLGGHHLRYAMYDGSTWHTENIGTSSGGDKKSLQLALSNADVPHICFFDEGSDRMGYATYSGSSWVKETDVISDDLEYESSMGRGKWCDIEVDQYGTPHISMDYNGYSQVGYLIKNGSTWDGWNLSSVASDETAVYTQLELDNSENPCIAHHNTKVGGDNIFRDVHLTCYNATSGELLQRDTGLFDSDFYYSSTKWGRYINMQLDQNDSAHIAFYDQTAMSIMYYTDNYYPTFDTDGDGIPDSEDNFPSNPSETADYDGDGIGDNADNDDDQDGVIDLIDDCQFGIIGAGADFDGDGCKDSEDSDDDNDGFSDDDDDCPKGMTGVGEDLDLDGCQDAEDSDIDGDGISNDDDDFERDATEDTDSDEDGVGDNADQFPNDANETVDSDGDGIGDNSDAFPDDANETLDSDGDGVGDNEDAFDNDANETTDSDGDGVGDNSDAFPNDANESSDFDGDGTGDNADIDVDGDNVSDDEDAFPNNPGEWNDTDGDGVGDNSDAFPNDFNESTDSDGDMVGDNTDQFPYDANESLDSDMDGVGDNADDFPNDANESLDSDGDGVGDNTDICPDGDDLIDADEDGIPDNCDQLVDSDGDGFDDAIDAFPNDKSEWIDSDGDGVGNNADAYPADPDRNQPEESNVESDEGTDDELDEEENTNSEPQSWTEFLKEQRIDSSLLMKIFAVFALLVIIKMNFSSRKIKKLKKELGDAVGSNNVWERLDFDGDGEISDLEFEAYKVIRDEGKQPESSNKQDGDSDDEDSENPILEL
ncbi:MAG: hypothetical protein CMB21_07310 [Euryarchaeota archaeon]|nr:hypothetical protein [Euryarchaeota archaeon]